MDLLSQAERGFARLTEQYEQRNELAANLVRNWEWATKAFWNLNPIYFEMNSERPGRRLAKEPTSKRDSYCCGIEAAGRIVVERQASEYGDNETFYDWSSNPVEVAVYENKSPVNLCLAIFDDRRVLRAAQSAIYGSAVEEYHWDGPRVTRIDIQYAERTSAGLQSVEPYQTVRPEYDEKGDVLRVLIDWLPRMPDVRKLETEVVFERRDKPAEIDLRKAGAAVRKMLAGAVEKFSRKQAGSRSAYDEPPITCIELIFSVGDGHSIPWIHLCFDNKPDGYPGGSYSSPEFATLSFRAWLPVIQATNEGARAIVIGVDGGRHAVGADTLLQFVGDFLVTSLLQARDEKVLETLPTADKCELGVEDPTTGAFGWPAYQDRGKHNLL